MADPSLVRAAAQGDHGAFAVLVEAALPRLDAAARFMVRDPGHAQDAVQDALIRVWRDLPSLRDPRYRAHGSGRQRLVWGRRR